MWVLIGFESNRPAKYTLPPARAGRMMLPSPLRGEQHHGMAAAQPERVEKVGDGLAA